MKRCNYCGREIDDYAIFCQHCGANQSDRNHRSHNEGASRYGSQNTANGYGVNGYRSMGYAVLAFFFPIVGFIMWYIWRYTRPGRATSLLKGAVASVAVGSPIVGFVAWFLMKDNYRYEELSRHILKCSLIGFGIAVVWNILMVIFYMYAPNVYNFIQRFYFTYYF